MVSKDNYEIVSSVQGVYDSLWLEYLISNEQILDKPTIFYEKKNTQNKPTLTNTRWTSDWKLSPNYPFLVENEYLLQGLKLIC